MGRLVGHNGFLIIIIANSTNSKACWLKFKIKKVIIKATMVEYLQ